MSTSSRPTNLWEPKNEVQEVKRQPALTLVYLEGVLVACMGGSGCTSKYSLPDDETAAELQSSLGSAYGAGAVVVSEDPEAAGRLLVESVGSLAKRYVSPLSVFSSEDRSDRGKVLVEGGSGRLVVSVLNLGDGAVEAAKSHLRIDDVLPGGVAAYHVDAVAGFNDIHGPVGCTIESSSRVVCSFAGTLPTFEAIELEIDVSLSGKPPVAGAPGEVSVSGANAPAVTSPQPVRVSGEATAFGVDDYSAVAEEEGGAPATQAGWHPFQFTTTVQVNQGAMRAGTRLEEQPAEPRNLRFTLPAGLVSDANSVAQCDFIAFSTQHALVNECPAETAIGAASITFDSGNLGLQHLAVPVFNLRPITGEPARFGYMAGGIPVILDPTVKTAQGYRVMVSVNNATEVVAFLAATVTFWGNPGDPRHDASRGWNCVYGEPPGPCTRPSHLSETAFLDLPTSCAEQLSFPMEMEPWNVPLGSELINASFTSTALDGCNKVPFDPSVEAALTGKLAEAPSGLGFQLTLPDSGLLNPGGISETQPKRVEVLLPEGVTLNPSAGEGLATCSPEQYARETAESLPGEGCPEASKLGSVQASTPLLEEEAHGSLYVATPYDNPFKSLLALYVVARIPDRGVLIKQAGEVIPDPNTGQLKTVFDGLPQLPYGSFKLQFREGGRAPLATPPACGTYTTTVKFLPWSSEHLADPSGSDFLTRESSFSIDHGIDGRPCPTGSSPPLAPSVISGTQNNSAGNYSPFYLRIVRGDGEQELTRFSTVLPPGLTANLNGIPFCPDAAIQHARQATGQQETREPSCPAASQIGHTLVGAGVGSVLAWTPGRVYLAGPYHGSGLSIVSVTSATVGPFDLGTVVIRFALRINPNTGQAEIDGSGSDPIPHILPPGIVAHVRDIHVYIDRPNFMINPTSCERLAITNTIAGAGADTASGTDDQTVNINTPFQAADCANLKFEPKFSASTLSKDSFNNQGASLKVNLAANQGPNGTTGQGVEANISKVKVELPKALPSRLTTLQKACTAAQFNTNPAGCPAASNIGYATVHTPIVPVPLTGPAIFVSHGGEAFPSLILVLQGYGITIDLTGATFISKSGITSSTFKTVPDQPFSTFELTLPTGKFSALAAITNVCKPTKKAMVKKRVAIKRHGKTVKVTKKVTKTVAAPLLMPTEMVAQNGAVLKQSTKIAVTGCRASKPAKKKKHRKAKKKGKRKKK
ncbi:MAG TPA: hypothetical protein VIJ66_04885 [Solirubrobacteraceae bacterium]